VNCDGNYSASEVLTFIGHWKEGLSPLAGDGFACPHGVQCSVSWTGCGVCYRDLDNASCPRACSMDVILSASIEYSTVE
jgi:hypothetical protein